jgi:predicted P-loop ATPase
LAAPSYPVQSRAGALGPGVDIKSDGGYVVAPPSLHASGDRYDWRPECNPGDTAPAPCPQWVLDRLQARKPRGQRPDSKLASAFAAAGWLGKRDRDGRWRCLCPWRAEHTSGADYDSSTVLLPATSEHPRARWLCSHGHCSSRTTGDAWGMLPKAAVEAAEQEWGERADPAVTAPISLEVPTTEEPAEWASELLRKAKGGLVACEANVLAILSHDPRWEGVLAWDAFGCRLAWRRDPPWGDNEQPAEGLPTWQDEDATRLVSWLHRQWKIRVSTALAHGVANVVGRRVSYHPVRDYLDGLKWDGIVRLERWLTTYLGAEDTEYTRAVGARWCVSAVARVREPGCQVDHMLVLEGPQGRRKSTALGMLCGRQWYCDRLSDPGSKDASQELGGLWIGEFSDLSTLRRAEIETIKAFVTRRTERYRPSYGRCVVEQPRQCIFAGTTNESEYLGDATGGRRFWPVHCGTIDVAALERDRDMLWAEAVARYESGEHWWLDCDELVEVAAEEQDERYVGDPWTDVVAEWLQGREAERLCELHGGVTTGDVLTGAVGLDKGKWDRSAQTRVGAILRRVGWPPGRSQKKHRRSRLYLRPAEEVANVANLETRSQDSYQQQQFESLKE